MKTFVASITMIATVCMVAVLIFDVRPSEWTRADVESVFRLPNKPSNETPAPAVSDSDEQFGDLQRTSKEPIRWRSPAQPEHNIEWTSPSPLRTQRPSRNLPLDDSASTESPGHSIQWTLERRIAAASVRLESADGIVGSGVIVTVRPHSFEILTADHLLSPTASGRLSGWNVTHLVLNQDQSEPNGTNNSTVPGMKWTTSRSLAVVRRDTAADLSLLRVSSSAAADRPIAISISGLEARSNPSIESNPTGSLVGQQV
ncbi:MAG: hypothetical protein AAF670_15000 [Planctomycetota bacterium]